MKKEIRKQILEKRRMIPLNEVEKRSKLIFSNIKNWDEFINSKVIMIYSSFNNEVSTFDFIGYCLNEGKRVILPRTIKKDNIILPVEIKSMDELIIGAYGILEPPSSFEVYTKDIDIIFVPGVAFDREGFRIGYGAGYYDRFLKDFSNITIGVCFKEQIVDKAYNDEHDIPVNYLLSDEGLIRVHIE